MTLPGYNLYDILFFLEIKAHFDYLPHEWFLSLEDPTLPVIVETHSEQPVPALEETIMVPSRYGINRQLKWD